MQTISRVSSRASVRSSVSRVRATDVGGPSGQAVSGAIKLSSERRDGIADPRDQTGLSKLFHEGVIQAEKPLARKTSALQYELYAVVPVVTYNGSRHALYFCSFQKSTCQEKSQRPRERS
jgi:hypothetical protein